MICFSKTLLLLFSPQVLNFVYSVPQLFKLVPCPRHRLPRCDVRTQLLHSSTFPCKEHEYTSFLWRAIRIKDSPGATEVAPSTTTTTTAAAIIMRSYTYHSAVSFYYASMKYCRINPYH